MANSKKLEAIISIAGQIDPSLKKSITQTTGLLKDMDNDMAALSVGFDTIGKVGKVAFAAVAAGATAVSAALLSCIDSGKEFEAQMSTAEAISGANAMEMDELKDKALDLAASTKFTATEIGQAYEYMGMAGWSAEEMLAGIPSVLNLAAAAGEDLATTSDILTDDMTAFGLSINTENIEHFADVLAATATNSNTTIEKMGDTFKYAGAIAKSMGFDFEDVAVATGLMANAGIKASQAGTSIRSWMSRLAAPTKQVTEAMDALGLEITDQEGNTKSFMQIIEETRKAMEGLTDTEKTRYAAAIAGKHAMTGMLAVVDAEEKDIRDLQAAIEDCNGAAEDMANIRLDNLEGDVTIMKSAFDGLKLSIYEELKEPARETVQDLTDLINQGKEKLPGMVSDMIEWGRKAWDSFRKFIQPAIDAGGDALEWIIKNKHLVIGAVSGIAAAFASFKILQWAKGAFEAARGLKLLLANMGPVGIAIAGITTAIGALTGAITAYNTWKNEMIKNNLAEHFGNISLSMSEIEAVAEQMINSKALEQAREQVEAFAKADELFAAIDTSGIDKTNWKVSVGLTLSEEDKESYKTEIDQFVKDSQAYVDQQAYAVSISMELFNPNDVTENGIATSVNKYYQAAQGQMRYLGARLQNEVNIAFNDGILDIDEVRVIQDLQRQMADIEAGLAVGKQKAKIYSLSMKYGFDLDAESSAALQQELAEQADEARETFRTAMETGLASVYNSGLTGEALETAKEKYLKDYLDNVTDAEITSLNYFTETATGHFKNLEESTEQITTRLKEIIKSGTFDQMDWQTYIEQARAGLETMSGLDQESLRSYLQNALPTEQAINDLVSEYTANNQQLPAELAEQVLEFYAVAIQAGETPVLSDALVEAIAKGEVNASKGPEVKADMEQAVVNTAQAFDDSVPAGYDKLDDAALKFYTYAEQSFKNKFASNTIQLDVPAMLKVSVIGVDDSEAVNALAGVKTSHVYSGSGSGGHYALAKGGFTQGVSIAGEEGTEAVISFDQSVRERNLNIWKMAGEMLGVKNVETASADRGDSGSSSSTSSTNITFSPNITINGNGDHDTIIAALREAESELLDMLEEYGLTPKGRGAKYAYE